MIVKRLKRTDKSLVEIINERGKRKVRIIADESLKQTNHTLQNQKLGKNYNYFLVIRGAILICLLWCKIIKLKSVFF